MDLLQLAAVVLGSSGFTAAVTYLATRPKARADAADSLVKTALRVAEDARAEVVSLTHRIRDIEAANASMADKYAVAMGELRMKTERIEHLEMEVDECRRDRAQMNDHVARLEARVAELERREIEGT